MSTSTEAETPLIPTSRLKQPVTRRTDATRSDIDVRGLWAELRRTVEGEIRFDPGSRAMYATDASNYRQVPIGVCIPKSKDDVVAIVAACRAFGAPLVSRAGGTSLAGQTCNAAVVIDWSKYMNRIVEIDPGERRARVLPGVICDSLVEAARPYGLTYGPCPATHSHCCFGGMLSNNSCGIHAQMAGKAVDNTEEMEILLYDGTRMNVGWMTDDDLDREVARGGRTGNIYANLRNLRNRCRSLVEERYPKIPRRVSGYNLDQLIPGPDGRFNVARSLVGTEGTCVTMLEMKVRIVENPPERVLVVLGYPDVYRSADHLLEVLPHHPIGLEGMDATLYEVVRKKHDPHGKYLSLLPAGNGWLVVEFGGQTREEAVFHAERLRDDLSRAPAPPSVRVITRKDEQQHLWTVREAGLGATAFVPGQPDSWEGWEDSAVAPEQLGAYLRDLRKLYEKYEYRSAMYGHFGMGCVHCRVNWDLTTAFGIQKWRSFMEEATDLVVRHGGSLSGEHGDGQSKAEFLYKMFGTDLMRAFAEFKWIWDPDRKMNPGKIVAPYRMDENLRLGPGYAPWEPETHFSYPEDHDSFAHATLRCVGVGKCRRLNGEGDQDTMCPSFMVTREEKHSTRGRAHLLFEMLQKGPIEDGWRDEHVKDALDLCLSCKGCKSDCPVNVDMATYKAEFLSHYWEKRLRPRSAYAFGLIDVWSRLASALPGFVNLLTQAPWVRSLAKAAAGIPKERQIPAFAARTFRSWFDGRPTENAGGDKVVLWADTFNNYFFPETAEAAVEVLEHAGFRVEVPRGHLCCGRPLYDYGMLDRAKRYLHHTLDALSETIRDRTPIVVLEPSCCSVFRDELPALLHDRGDARRLSEQVVTLSEFLTSPRVRATGYTPPKMSGRAIVQGHCHHKAIMHFEPERRILGEMGLDAEVLESGCCGMAGSFGYEGKTKYAVSVAAGERVLLPEVRSSAPTTLVIADGFSCKEQIAQSTNRGALHLAEVMKLAIDQSGDGRSPAAFPERAAIDARVRRQERSMARAAALAGVGALVVGAWLLRPAKKPRRTRRFL